MRKSLPKTPHSEPSSRVPRRCRAALLAVAGGPRATTRG